MLSLAVAATSIGLRAGGRRSWAIAGGEKQSARSVHLPKRGRTVERASHHVGAPADQGMQQFGTAGTQVGKVEVAREAQVVGLCIADPDVDRLAGIGADLELKVLACNGFGGNQGHAGVDIT